MREKFPAILNPFHAERSSVGPHAVTLQDDLLLPWTFVTQSMMKLLEHRKITTSTDGFPQGKSSKNRLMFTLHHPMVCRFLSTWKWCNQLMSPITMLRRNCHLWRHTVPALARKHFFFAKVCAPLSASEEARRHKISRIPTFHHLLDCLVPYSNLFSHFPHCQKSTPCDKLINFSIFSHGKGSSQATKMGLISDTCVPIFKLLYPTSDTTSAHVGIFICTLQLRMNTRCGDFLLSKKFYHCTLLKQHGLASQLFALNKTTLQG
jgi:hypothetical protein